ncbi:MAG: coproporphyrinogen dehydrogenase HemZ [Firmicutes bacterium]|nr:coproporphyrinogen dehydrogenase HemZ [Bacillota bacterium]
MTIRLFTPLSAHFSDLAEVIRVFFPEAEVVAGVADACDIAHETHLYSDEAGYWAEDTFTFAGNTFRWTTKVRGDRWERKRRRKRGMKQSLYYLLKRGTRISPPWGSLTGIRPTRLFYDRLHGGDKPAAARQALIRLYDLREDRARLLEDTVLTQRGLMEAAANAIDLYVGVPFCVSRCAYCSFFAEAVGKGEKVAPYMEALLRETDAVAELTSRHGLLPRAVYVGGGTPTALDAATLSRLLMRLRLLFPAAGEWTVEAGRPDTIDRDKLQACRDAGVTRVCINPQSMNDETLAVIARAHTRQDTERAFGLSRAIGFDNINMDVIAALPGEGPEDFFRTLDAVSALAPDSLTVHALARKHGSRLNEFGFEPTKAEAAETMVEMGATFACGMGMRPYYLYRQKYVAGNLENVAYARPGKECLYNVDIMEETTSILAMGAGAISKRVFPGEGRIERAPNVGDVGHYLARVDEMIARKERLWRE